MDTQTLIYQFKMNLRSIMMSLVGKRCQSLLRWEVKITKLKRLTFLLTFLCEVSSTERNFLVER